MKYFRRIVNYFFYSIRINRIYCDHKNFKKLQQEELFKIINLTKSTKWGTIYKYGEINSIEDFQKNVPISKYEEIAPFVEEMLKGEKNILWPGFVKNFSKSSGTTNAKSKYIPLPDISLQKNHFNQGMDMISVYLYNNKYSRVLFGKTLSITGSLSNSPFGNKDIMVGDVSAVIASNVPKWAHIIRTPKLSTALLSDWKEKVKNIVDSASKENVVALLGTPTWVSVILNRLNENTNKPVSASWKNLEVFFHGAVSFAPYKTLFKELLPDKKINYVEVYNASEGFFAFSDDMEKPEEMLLCLSGVFYEFIPLSEFVKGERNSITLENVVCGVSYVLIITTYGGLSRYIIGDTISFVNLDPFKIIFTGRTKYFLNAFGEELEAFHVEKALKESLQKTGGSIKNFTVAPLYMKDGKSGAHEWLIEWSFEPSDVLLFENSVDEIIKNLNSDYEAKRMNDSILGKPVFRYLPENTFNLWMEKRGKLGGQNKVPILSNNREYVDDIINTL